MDRIDTKILSAESIPLHLDSRTIELGRYFTKKGALPQLLVLVEGEDDKPFWQKMFSCVADKYSSIDIWPLQEAAANYMYQYDLSENLLSATGKDTLMKITGLGVSKMIAVDADYDLLIDNYHSYTELLRTNQYIQHTLYYSIENHLIDNELILSCPKVTFFCQRSAIFVKYIIGEIRHRILERENGRDYNKLLTIDELRSKLSSYQYNANKFCKEFFDLVDNLKEQCAQKISSDRLNEVVLFCKNKGYLDDDMWQLMQGHTLLEFVSKIMVNELKMQRQQAEHGVNKNLILSGEEKADKIKSLKTELLGSYRNEKEMFLNDVYNCKYLIENSKEINKIKDKIMQAVRNN